MSRRVRLAWLLAAVAGCQAVTSRAPQAPPPAPPVAQPLVPNRLVSLKPAAPPSLPAGPPPPTVEPPSPPDELSLAADCLERGDDAAAAAHLGRHIGEHPDQLVFRAQLAHLLSRLDRLPEAQVQYEAAAALAQDGPATSRRDLVHYHTRLMEIARRRDDAYAENLHRGIGLYLVGRRLAEKDAADAERLLCKAAAALKEAQAARPDDARAAWYLYRVWSQLDQARPADRALRKALAAAPFSHMTPAESRELAAVSLPRMFPK